MKFIEEGDSKERVRMKGTSRKGKCEGNIEEEGRVKGIPRKGQGRRQMAGT